MVQKAKEMGMPAIGLTDHGTIGGIMSFLKECRKRRKDFDEKYTSKWKGSYENGIKPILGMESYFCRNHHCHDKIGQPDGRKGNRHLNIIAKNYKGYQNLCTLSQRASLEGTYYDPRVDLELLNEYKEGLIVTSACLSNIVNWHLANDRYDQAKRAAGIFQDIFGEDYYLEMMFHGIDSEGKILPDIQKLGKDLNIKTIVTNDAHYENRADSEYHEYVMCISSKRSIRDPKRLKFPFDEFYLKSEEEMKVVFGHCRQSMLNTLEIADKCDYSEIIFVEEGGTMKLPHFDLPEGFDDPFAYLYDLAWKGLSRERLDKSEVHRARLKRELDDIKLIWDTKRYDFSTYFLIVEDMMKFSNKNGISSGIRGSGFGSLLLKCLGITEGVDPIEQDLLWERFLGFDDAYFISESDFGIDGHSKS